MRRKHLMTALMCTFVLAAASVMPMAALAEGTEAATEAVTEAAEEKAEEEAAEAESEEGSSEAEEEQAAPLEYPEYEALEYVELGEYKGITVVPDSTKATDLEIDLEILSAAQRNSALEILQEGVVQNADKVLIDYEGKRDGVAFEGGTAKDSELVIGSNSFIAGFEAGLVGVAVGETVDLNLTFPEEYHAADLAGAEVVFTVTVNEIQRAPELTEELVSAWTEGAYTDGEAYRESIRETIEGYKESMKDGDILNKILIQLADSSEIKDYPQEMVDYGVENMMIFYRDMAEQYEMEFADFVLNFFGMSEDQFRAEAESAVKQNLQQELYLKAIAEKEGITLTDTEYEEGCARYAESYGYASSELLVAEYGEGMVRSSVLQEKVLDFLVENAEVQEPETETESESVTEE